MCLIAANIFGKVKAKNISLVAHVFSDTAHICVVHTDESYGGLSVELKILITVSVVLLVIIIIASVVVVVVCVRKRHKKLEGSM